MAVKAHKAAKSSSSVWTTRRCGFRLARARLRRASFPVSETIRGHSAATKIATAHASSAMKSQLTARF